MGQLHNVVFQEPLLWISWMSDVIRLAVKGAVVVCPKDDVIRLSLILVFRKNVFCGLWDMTISGKNDK